MVQGKPDGPASAAPAGPPSIDASSSAALVAAGPLDLHEGIADPPATGCLRWPAPMRLLASTGELVQGRCRATNQCPYCRILAVVETAEMLWLDAAEYAPTLWI